jgi:transcriptional regulator with XRE-family HTH domain
MKTQVLGGRELKEMRQAAGLTLRALGVRVGVDSAYLFRVERGDCPLSPRVDALLRPILRAELMAQLDRVGRAAGKLVAV